MTERYQGWSVPGLYSDGHDDSKSRPEQRSFHSGFTAINQQHQQNTSQLTIGEVGASSHADVLVHADADADFHVDIDISHAAKHPIVAQYLGIGLDDAHVSRLERQATTINKMRPYAATADSTSSASKQAKETAKKRSVSAPQPKPAKKTKRARSDEGHATESASASKTTTRSKKKRLSAPSTKGNTDNFIHYDSGRQREDLPNNPFALSEQTAQKLSAWRFQPLFSTSALIEATAQPDADNGHQIDSQPAWTSRAVTTVHPSVRAPSNIISASDTSRATNPWSSLTSSAARTATPAASQPPVCTFTSESHSLLSHVTSSDVIKDSQGFGHSIYRSAPRSSSSNRLTISKPSPEPQAALTPPRPPPTSGHHVLETIFEESAPSSVERAREVPNHVPESSIAPISDCTEPSSTGAVDTDDPFEDDLFNDLDDADLLDFEISSEVTNLAPKQVIRSELDPDIINLVSDDEWNILEDEEIAFLDLTDDVAHERPASTAKIRDRSKVHPTGSTINDDNHETPIIQSECTPSQQEQVSPQLHTITAAEATEDYLNAILHPPIIRPPFPKPIRDRSPLVGVSASLVLKTCFRIGECLNVGCTFARKSNTQSSDTILIELYAKVISSHRDTNSVTQHFVLADLFHERRGPFLNAMCETWKGSELWEYDCGRFLCADVGGEKKICRAVGRMKREGGKWRFVVLNIWQATWEDVEFVRGIICGV
ncbi:hypothetical protein E2P81_ATG10079 [Venturia nashicola]|uniref:Uncharacterized protein n=1 Tax=Venturia nashicola TaxID=86259 RepID=A0A4Z1NFL8_9PEZI|nr:hypothetical protein E6O75_ATG10298 [Venturia nashicola]TLD18257.1 hypothetical protein E2P81_ATG10079 [Venturia nashicola]